MKATMKKVLSMLLVVTLTAGITIGGTMAYLTMDAGDENNVFSIGNIDVSLDEEVGVFGEGGEVKETEDGAEYIEVMPGDYLKKEVSVTNNGKTPAYVAVTVTLKNATNDFTSRLSVAIDDHYENLYYTEAQVQDIYDDIFDGWGINYTHANEYGTDTRNTITAGDTVNTTWPEHVLKVDYAETIQDYWLYSMGNWFLGEYETSEAYWVDSWKAKDNFDKGYYTGDMGAYEARYTYYLYLPAGESSTLFEGLNIPAEFNAEQLAMFDGLKIDVEAKAIQAENMAIASQYAGDENAKAKTAFAILAGDIETPEYSSKPSGKMGAAYTSADRIWGEHGSNAKETHVIKIYSGDTYMGETSLNNVDGIIDGDVYVTWSIALDGKSTDYWTMKWEKAPSIDLMPTTVELWVDGVKVDENEVQMNGPDALNKITGAVVNADGVILRYVVGDKEPSVQDGETYVPFISSDDALSTAITNGATTVVLNDGTYHMPTSAKSKTLTFIGAGTDDTTIEIVPAGQGEANGQLDYNLDGSTVTFNNLTIKTNNKTYAGYARLTATYNNCVFENQYCLNGNSEFNNCIFNVSGDVYNIWTWGAPNATFNGCTFNSDGKALLLYGTVDTNLTIDNCVFNDNGGLTDLKAAIEIGNDYNKSYELIVKKTVVNGYEINDKGINTGTTLWANKNSMSKDNLNVVVDGVDVY